MKRKIPLLIGYIFFVFNVHSQENFPHLLIKNEDKQLILQKIDEQPWANHTYNRFLENTRPYVERHRTDPDWILSRYLMNRVEGKRYTHAYSDSEGTRLVRYSGDAPVPTVRWSTHKRNPNTVLGRPYRKPSIEELIPNDTCMNIWCLNTETNKKELIDPQLLVNSINGEINELALNAAVIYWLYGDEAYARFAADILDQWARGASYQYPIEGPHRTGFLSIQTLNDLSYENLILAYDFLYPFMKKAGYEMSYYQNVFEKFASTLAFRGYWSSNWYAAVSSTLVYASLSLEDSKKREYYLQFFLEKDTINGMYGNLGLPSTMKTHFTPDGHWKEPGGYHNFPVSGLIRAAWAADQNGHPVFQKFPGLFDATHVLLKYAFPDLRHPGFGDAGYSSPDPTMLEFGLAVAAKYNLPELPGMVSALNTLMEKGSYRRERSGIYGLLLFLPEIPTVNDISYSWPRSGVLDYARYFLQRNGMEEKTGLMFGVHGATYNHNQCNGMAMELYGCGYMMGLEMGIGAHYDHYLYKEYYNRWAAHNTVVAGGCSDCLTGYPKNYGQIELISMEPMADIEAISPSYSYTSTSYRDGSTNTNQLRTLGIIRTSDVAGYYIDFYRSDHTGSNDYIYHNLGDTVLFLNQKGENLKTNSTDYPITGDDSPGFRHFSGVEKLEDYRQNLVGLFPVNDGSDNYSYMKFFIPGSDERIYYKAYAPEANTATSHYRRKELPLFTIRKEKEAWSDPFIVVFEPCCAETKNSIKSVERISDLCNENNTVVRISHFDGSEQIVFQGNDSDSQVRNEQFGFSGHFGVISLTNGKIERLYLGEGNFISYGGIYLSALGENTSAEIQFLDDNTYQVSANGLITVKNDQ